MSFQNEPLQWASACILTNVGDGRLHENKEQLSYLQC